MLKIMIFTSVEFSNLWTCIFLAQFFAQFYKKSNNIIQLNPSLVYIRKWDQLVETMMKAIMVRQLQLFKQHSVKL